MKLGLSQGKERELRASGNRGLTRYEYLELREEVNRGMDTACGVQVQNFYSSPYIIRTIKSQESEDVSCSHELQNSSLCTQYLLLIPNVSHFNPVYTDTQFN
jgi:hypothetical protein